MMNLTKSFLTIVSASLFLACQNNQQTSHIATNTDLQTYKSAGIIKQVDKENGKITIDHEEIEGYMSAMEMTESVSDKSILETIKVGDKVDFEIERTGSKLIITKLNKIGEVAVLNGAEIYRTNCSSCHRNNGEGAKKGISLTSGHALHHSETEHIKQVTDGEGKKMPAFKDKLSAEQIAEVVKFIRTDLQKNTVREESGKHKH
jgi:Cu(I)/Ag(I) efflux system periplasmic protein CusF